MHFPEDFFRWLVIFSVRAQQQKKPLFVGTLLNREKIGKALTRIALAVALSIMPVSLSSADQPREHNFNIPQQSVQTALTSLANQANVYLLFPYDQVIAVNANAVQGTYSVQQALNMLLHNTGLSGDLTEGGVLAISRAGANASATENHGKGKSMNITNSSKRKTVLAGLVGLFAAGGMTQAVAQGGEAATGQSAIDEIIVTAQKREQNIIDVPISIVSLDGTTLTQQGISDLSDLALAVPDLSIFDIGGAGARELYIRGIGNTRGSSPLTGVYMDEASMTNALTKQADLRIYDLERVEVLRGPQGTLYGEGSMGGTVRLITKDPELDSVSGHAKLSASWTDDGDPSEEIKGVINLPLIENELGLRISGVLQNNSGWIDQPDISRSNVNDEEVANIRIKSLWTPSEELQIKGSVIVHRNNAGAFNLGENEDGNLIQTFQGLTNPPPVSPSGEHDYEQYNITINYDLGSVSLVSSTSYLDLLNVERELGYRLPFFGPASTTAPFDVRVRQRDHDTNTLSQEIRLSSDGDSALGWSTGVFYRDSELELDLNSVFAIPGTALIPFNQHSIQATESWAVFGEINYALTERLEIGAGVRYFEDEQEFTDFIANTQQSETFDAVTTRIYASYDISSEIKAYASVSEGFRSGAFNAFGIPPVEPEDLRSYELGTKMSLLDRRMSIELALFYSDYEDVQVNGFDFVGGQLLQFSANSGDARIEGADLNLSMLATDNLSFGVGGSYVDTEMKEVRAVVASHAEGDPLDGIPKYHVTLWSKYEFDWSENTPGFVRIDYNQQGESFTRDNTLGPWWAGSSDIINNLNLIAGLERNQWSIELFGRNILNDRGYVDSNVAAEFATRARPRTIGLNVKVDF